MKQINLTKFKQLLFFIILSFAPFLLEAQQTVQVKGKVVDAVTNNPLNGVSVTVKNSAYGTTTNAEGVFTIDFTQGEKLIVSFSGYQSQQIKATDKFVTIKLEIVAKQLEDVVVTALGIKKDKKRLGYALQEVKGDQLTVARESNVVSQLAGKVAGVTVVGSNSGIGGSARVSIRGERSVDLNKNQPLYVIDGVPVSNAIAGGSGRGNLEVDFGNGAGFINPDDIESISVLKGPAASALYGSRAANGVILIKSKAGKNGKKGIGVEVNSNLTLENALKLPKYQKVYGQGAGDGRPFAFVNGGGSGITDGTDEGWGPAFNGQSYAQFNSSRTLNGAVIPFLGGDLNAPAGSVITATPWVADNDNLKNFLQTGTTFTNNVALTGANDNGDYRLSFTNLDQKGIVPNTDLKRKTISISGSYNFNKKFSARSFVSYIKSTSGNRPSISYGTENIMYLFNCWLPASVKVSDMKRLWMPGEEGKRQFGWNYNYHDNPYLTVMENTNGQFYDRLIGNILLKYDFTDWLNLQLRTASDWSNERREYRRAFSTQRFPFGEYREVKIINEERNTDFLLSANKKINADFAFTANFGGNQMRQTSRNAEDVAGQLNIPGIYSLNNSRIALVVEQNNVGKRINSLYSAAGISYKNKLFLDITGRNDWSSALTLPQNLKAFGSEVNSYFYSSIAASAIISDMIALPKAISFAKLRASFAQVGNDTDPFTFTQTYTRSDPFGAAQVYSETSRLSNLNLKPEISSAYEFGIDVRVLKNRIGLDVTFYQSNTKNQILNIPLSVTSGYNTRVINAGLIKNYGIEAILNINGIKNKNFTWNTDINFSTNRSKVIELSDGLRIYQMASKHAISIEARVGERMGDMYGLPFARVQNTDPTAPYYDAKSDFVGQIVHAANGRPIRTTNRVKLGNYNPDWLMGISNRFAYKNFNLSFLFDIRSGGKIYSQTQVVGREGGIIMETLEGRANGYDLAQAGNGVIGAGVVASGTGYVTNTTKVSAREWHTAYTSGRNIAEGVMYDASFVKLRELQLGFSVPSKLLSKLPFTAVNISLVGRNLWLKDNVPHVDPETMSFNGGTAIPGIEAMAIPSTRSYGVNLSLKF